MPIEDMHTYKVNDVRQLIVRFKIVTANKLGVITVRMYVYKNKLQHCFLTDGRATY